VRKQAALLALMSMHKEAPTYQGERRLTPTLPARDKREQRSTEHRQPLTATSTPGLMQPLQIAIETLCVRT
jgi:hypothetical protein